MRWTGPHTILVAFGLACAPAEPHSLGDFIQVYYQDQPAQICVGSAGHFDRYITRTFDFLDEPIPRGFTIPVAVEPENPCGDFHTGCYLPSEDKVYIQGFDEVDSRTMGVLRHETTHAIVDRVWGWSIPFFNEGLAESLARTYQEAVSSSTDNVPVGEMFEETDDTLDYNAAARFVHFLIVSYGIEKFKKLYQAAQRADNAVIQGLFERVYGVAFTQIEEDYLSAGSGCTFQLDMCDDDHIDPLPPVGGPAIVAACGDRQFFGTAETWISTMKTYSLHQGRYLLQPSAQLIRCGECDEQYTRRPTTGPEEIELEAGLYSIEMQFSGERDIVLVSPFTLAELDVETHRNL